MIRSFAALALLLACSAASAQPVPQEVPPPADVALPTLTTEPPSFALAIDGPAVGAPDAGRRSRAEVVLIRQEDGRRGKFKWKVEPAGRVGVDAEDFGGSLPEGTLDLRRGQSSAPIAFEVHGRGDKPYPRGFRVTVTGPITAKGEGEAGSVEMFLFDEGEAFRGRGGGAMFGAKPS
ncbi:MAG: hypothetical protein K2X91_10375 [Thermoleophilia bacterium]|jgi:hypothetical protein|nr:hypothetical protein [Thermoleophilia bacterium]